MDKASVEFTKEEAQIIAQLLPQVPVHGTVAGAQNIMKLAIQVDGIIRKIAAAFGETPVSPELAATELEKVNGNGTPPPVSIFQPKRKRKTL